MHLELMAPRAGGSYASCWRLRHANGYFGDPIWLLVNVDGALPPVGPTQREQQQGGEQMQQEQLQYQQMMQMQTMQQGGGACSTPK